eukprot:2073839-Rhodomonas_salina.2
MSRSLPLRMSLTVALLHVGRGARMSQLASSPGNEVSERTDKHGNINLNVDIERNGQTVARDTGLKVRRWVHACV